MKQLRKLKATEVSLVPAGMNNKVFSIVKEAPADATGISALLERVKKAVKSFGKKDDKPDAEEKIGQDLSPQAQTALNATALILAPHKDEITDEHMDAIQAEVGIEGGGDGDSDVKPDHMKEALGEAKKAFQEKLKKLGYQKYPEGELTMKGKNSASELEGDDDDDEEEDVGKQNEAAAVVPVSILKEDGSINLEAVPENMRAFATVMVAKSADADKRAAAAEAKSAVLEKALVDTKAANRKAEIASISKEFTLLDKELVQTSLELADAVSKEKFDTVLAKFQVQEKIVKESSFSTIGSSAGRVSGGAGNDHDIMVKVAKAVEGIVAKSAADGVKITKEQAEADFLISPAGKALYDQHKSQRQALRADGA